jgi:VanZ family protein
MTKMRVFLSNYRFSLLCTALIWYLSIWFMPPDIPELRNVAFIDKWTHFVMYGTLTSIIWWEYLRRHSTLQPLRLFLFAWLAPALMSGVIEIIQETCTATRAGEWLDLAANTTGCTIGAACGMIMKWMRGKR